VRSIHTGSHFAALVSAGRNLFRNLSHGGLRPQDLAKSWHRARDAWLAQHGIDPQKNWKHRFELLPAAERQEFNAKFTRVFMEYLDQGHGECLLRLPEVAKLVAESLHHFDDDRYALGDYVIMPNHVHLLVCLRGSTEIEAQCHSWKKFSATQINRLVGDRGRFWQEESFDHLVRSPEQFDYLRRYIAENPSKAKLSSGQCLHWVRPES